MTAASRALLVLGSVVWAETAHAQEIQHVVKAGDTCSAIAQLYYKDSRRVDLLHKANAALQVSPPPHVLKEGTIIVVPPLHDLPPVAPGSNPDAQLTTVRNKVEVLTPETKPGKPNDQLFRGNRVSTQEASAADVTFRDETQVKLGERTLVIILGDSRSAAAKEKRPDMETQLVTGNLRTWLAARHGVPVTKTDSVVKVGTDAATVRVFASEAQVSTDEKKTTRLAVYSGSATIDARGKTHEVTRGFGSKAELGQAPSAPKPLPPPPTWTTRPPTVILDHPAINLGPIVGEYDLAALPTTSKVVEWHVQISRDELFREVIVDTRAPLAVKRLETQAPGPGHYFTRVSAVDDDHFEGPWSRTAPTLIVKGVMTQISPSVRRFEVEPADATCIRVGNSPLTWLKGPIELGTKEPLRLRCAPFATDPTTLLTFE